MFKKFIKENIKLTVVATLLLVPAILSASQFATDPDLEVFPSNQTLEFNTKVNTTESKSFSIKNSSNEEKTLIMSQTPGNSFKYNGSSTIKIGANSTTYLSIQFSPTTTGTFNSHLKIITSDSGESKRISLEGTSFSTTSNNSLVTSTNRIDFGKKEIDSKSEFTLKINNNNNKTININPNSLNKPFKLKSFPANISANSSANFIIEFEPTIDGSFEDTLIIKTSDKNTETIKIGVKGKTNDETYDKRNGKPLQFNYSTLNFGPKKIETSTSKTIKIYNPNSFDVEIKKLDNLEKPFKSSGINNKALIESKKEKTIKIIFEPTRSGSFKDALTFSTNIDKYEKASIQVSGSTTGIQSPPSNNPFTPNQPTIDNSSKSTSLSISQTKINPDLKETSYFNLYLGTDFNLSNNTATLNIFDTKNGDRIYTQNVYNLNQKGNNWKIKWNGSNFNNNTVIEGTYRYELKAKSPSNYQKVFNGYLQVTRNKNYIKQPIKTTPPKTLNTPSTPKSTQKISQSCESFKDVDYDSNLCSSVEFLVSQKVIRKDDKLNKDKEITRAQALSSIIQLLDIELQDYSTANDKDLGFKDLDNNEWYMPFIKTAKNLNTKTPVINTKQDEFRPNETITRAELYKFFIELANNNSSNTIQFDTDYFLTKQPFKDTKVGSSTDWFTPYAGVAQKEFDGTNFARKYFGSFKLNDSKSNFNPTQKVTKEELIEFLYETKKLRLVKYK